MIPAPLPQNEFERLQALRKTALLDTISTSEHQEMVDLAAEICETSIALISLVDEERQWFLARHGLDALETHRDLAFCAHAIHDPDPLVVSDALLDERFKRNPLVTENPKIRFYAGAPLIDEDGFALGTLCVIDREPRELSAYQLQALQTLSRLIIKSIKRDKADKQLKATQENLQHLLDQRNEFVRRTSAEMQDLLTNAIGISDLLNERCGDQEAIPNEIRQWSKLLIDSTKRAAELVNNVTDLNRLECDHIRPILRVCYPGEWLSDLVTRYRKIAEQKAQTIKLTISPQVPIHVTTDIIRLEEAVSHILDNALKFSSEGDRIQIAADQGINNSLRIVIRDQGIGIEHEHLEAVWKPFEQGGSEGESYGGSGLGLPIARQLVRLIQGTITLSSHRHTGTVVSMTIPSLDAPRYKTISDRFYRAEPQHIPNVWLVIDDDPVALALARAQAQRFGGTCETRSTTSELAQYIRQINPDVVLLDRHINGTETLIDWKNLGQQMAKVPPVILLSHDVSPPTRMVARDAGITHVLRKPVQPKPLRNMLLQITAEHKNSDTAG